MHVDTVKSGGAALLGLLIPHPDTLKVKQIPNCRSHATVPLGVELRSVGLEGIGVQHMRGCGIVSRRYDGGGRHPRQPQSLFIKKLWLVRIFENYALPIILSSLRRSRKITLPMINPDPNVCLASHISIPKNWVLFTVPEADITQDGELGSDRCWRSVDNWSIRRSRL